MDCSDLRIALDSVPENSPPNHPQNNQPPAPRPNSLRSDIVQKICGSCNKENAKSKCGRCQSIYYCNAECQKRHWPVHKVGCQVLGTQSQNQPVEPMNAESNFGPNKSPLQFATRYQNKCLVRPEKLAEIRQEGYQGVKGVDLNKILLSKGHNEVLKYIWTEDNYLSRINVLTPLAKNGHPLLMLELSRAFILRAVEVAKKADRPIVPLSSIQRPTFSSNLKNAFSWYIQGHLCMNIDIQCLQIKDNMQIATLKKETDILLKQYNPAWHIEDKAQPVTHFDGLCETLVGLYPAWKPFSNSPSPRWIIGDTASPDKSWLEMRKQITETILNEDATHTLSAIRVGECNHPVWDKMMK